MNSRKRTNDSINPFIAALIILFGVIGYFLLVILIALCCVALIFIIIALLWLWIGLLISHTVIGIIVTLIVAWLAIAFFLATLKL
jgi:hypothetical protein